MYCLRPAFRRSDANVLISNNSSAHFCLWVCAAVFAWSEEIVGVLWGCRSMFLGRKWTTWAMLRFFSRRSRRKGRAGQKSLGATAQAATNAPNVNKAKKHHIICRILLPDSSDLTIELSVRRPRLITVPKFQMHRAHKGKESRTNNLCYFCRRKLWDRNCWIRCTIPWTWLKRTTSDCSSQILRMSNIGWIPRSLWRSKWRVSEYQYMSSFVGKRHSRWHLDNRIWCELWAKYRSSSSPCLTQLGLHTHSGSEWSSIRPNQTCFVRNWQDTNSSSNWNMTCSPARWLYRTKQWLSWQHWTCSVCIIYRSDHINVLSWTLNVCLFR